MEIDSRESTVIDVGERVIECFTLVKDAGDDVGVRVEASEWAERLVYGVRL